MARVNLLVHFTKWNRLFNLHIPYWALWTIGSLILLAVPLFAFLVSDRSRRVVDQTRLVSLERENSILKSKLRDFDRTVRTLKGELSGLAEYDTKLRIATSLELVHPDLRSLGTGGRVEDTLSLALKQHGPSSYAAARNVDEALQHLLDEARFQKKSFQEIENFLDKQEQLRDHTPSIWPCSGWMMSTFGYRHDPFTGKIAMHEGIDVAAPPGTPICASADGYVSFAGPKQGYGLCIEVNHGYGYQTRYAHCQALKVSSGDLVRRGDVVGFVGSSGRTTGPHLHYEVEVSNVKVNPVGYIISEPAILD